MPNPVAYLMLGLWPVVVWVLFTRLDPARALIWTIIGGYLALPPVQAAIQIPGVPDLNKASIPNLMALVCAVFLLKDRISFWPHGWVGKALIGLFVVGPFLTVLTNADPLTGPALYVPGMRIYDSVSAVSNQAIALLPFFLARHYLATPDALRALTVALVAAGLVYAAPMLVEVAVSPQINIWVYGFFQHDFTQTYRYGGYRPMVFLPHGLWMAFFTMMTCVAAVVLARWTPASDRSKWVGAAVFLAGMLVLCRSAGPLIYAVALVPLVLVAPPRLQLFVAGALAVVVITYPLLRGLHLVPLDTILQLAGSANAERADSLAFRITNEEILLNRAQERPLFGWGGYARNQVHNPETGAVLTISDGMWIIVLGIFGWCGYVATFGLLVLPLLMLARQAIRTVGQKVSPYAGLVGLFLAVNLVDLLPNATLVPLTWLMAGALLGHAEARLREGVPAALANSFGQVPVGRRRTIL